MSRASKPSRDWLAVVAGGLLGVLLLLHIRRYAGINHDAVLYMGQGLLHRWPEIYSADPFFSHGSQEKFSLFPRLLALAFGVAPPPLVFLLGTLGSLLLFGAASWCCLRTMMPAGQRFWSWLAVLTLPSSYGFAGMFAYGEQFFTPRTLAEALCLLAIGLLSLRRWVIGFGMLAVATVLHPLQTIAASIIIWMWLIQRDRRWLHALWVLLPVGVLAALGVAPFGGLFVRMDPPWMESLHRFTAQLFVGRWRASEYVLLAFDLCVLLYGWRSLRGTLGQWCLAALAGGVAGIASSYVLVDVLHLALPAGLQLWRVHWLLHWLAMATIGAFLWRDVMARDFPRALLLCLIVVFAAGGFGLGWCAGMALYLGWSLLRSRSSEAFLRLLGGLFVLGILVVFGNFVLSEWVFFRMAHYRLDLYAIDRRVLAFPMFALALAATMAVYWSKLPPRTRIIVICIVLFPLLTVGLLRWDSRPPINRAIEQAAFQSGIFGTPLPSDAQIYWDDDSLIGPWLVLKRASYFSPGHLAGLVFNRETAVDTNNRLGRVMPIIEEGLRCRDRSLPLEAREHCHISDGALRRACTATSERRPDYLVLHYDQPQHAVGEWTIADPVTGEAAVTYKLFRCTDLLAELPPKPEEGQH